MAYVEEASAGFEPANRGFADRSLKPLGYDAKYRENLTVRKADSNEDQLRF